MVHRQKHQSGGIPVSASWPEMVNETPAGLGGEAEGPTQSLSSGTEWTWHGYMVWV